MKTSLSAAKTALGYLNEFGTPERAMGQIEVSLAAIKPYSCAALDDAWAVLAWIARKPEPRLENLRRFVASRVA